MKKVAKYIAGLFAALIAVGLFLPSSARVERSIIIAAPAATVFALVNDFRQINQWSPWVKLDPNALFRLSGAPRGEGAILTWDGQIVGRGSQRIISSEAYSSVVSEVDLGGNRPAITSFAIDAVESGTQVVWSFNDDFGLNIARRYFGLLLDGIVGPDYEKGLTALKAMAERLPAGDFSDIEIEHRTVEAMELVFLETSSAANAAAISEALGDAYFELLNYIDEHELHEAGAPQSIGGTFDGAALRFKAAIPVRGLNDSLRESAGKVRTANSYDGRVIRVRHVGAYRALGQTHNKIAAYLAALGIRRNGESWESYVSDPTKVPEDELITYVYYPIQPQQ